MLVGVWKSPIGRQNLLRQTVITVIFTVPINFIHIQVDRGLQLYQSLCTLKNSTTAYRNHNNANPVLVSPQCYAGHPAETKDSTLCRM